MSLPVNPLYFAYGSNMDRRQMAERVPGCRLVGTAHLPGHEFLFSGYSRTWDGAVANVKPSRKPGAKVFGVVWQLPLYGLEALDRFEGYPTAYQRKEATVKLTSGPTASCVLYYRRALSQQAPPNPRYVQFILDALKQHGQG